MSVIFRVLMLLKFHEGDTEYIRVTPMQQVCVIAKETSIFYNLFFPHANFSNLCPGENSIFIVLDSKQAFPLFQRDTPSLSSEVICYMDILEKKIMDNSF